MVQEAAAFIVFLAWGSMLLGLRLQQSRAKRSIAKRAGISRVGIILQGAAFGAVFGIRPQSAGFFSNVWGENPRLVAIVADVIAVTGSALVIWSQRVLGAQWSISARLLTDHRLVTTGPYRYVRHPIYLAMMLLLVATGLAMTTPSVLATALVLYIGGTLVRIRAEETLMRDAFGAEFMAYRARVPALFPAPGFLRK